MQNFSDLIGGENHLRSSSFLSQEAAQHAGLLNCDFHSRFKEDMVHQLFKHIATKAEFTETPAFDMNGTRVDMDVYVFSPEEIKRIARDVNAAIIGAPNRDSDVRRIKELHQLNTNQLGLIQRLEKELLHLQKLSVDIAMYSPPPIILVEGTSYGKGKEDGRKEMQKRLDEALAACVKHADRARELGDLVAAGVAEILCKKERIAELEYSLKGIQQETKEALDPFKL